jgi:hypothetical protein
MTPGKPEPQPKRRIAPIVFVAWAALLLPVGLIAFRYPEWRRAARVRAEQRQRTIRDSNARPQIHSDLNRAALAGNATAFASAVSRLPHGAGDVDACIALRDSIRAGRVEILQYWLDHGWPVTLNGESILSGCLGTACMSENPTVVRLLLSKGASLEYGGDCLLSAAAGNTDGEAEIAILLIRAGADPNKAFTDHHPFEPLYMPPYLLWASESDRDRFGFTPLMLAARNGSKEVVRALLAKGADARLRNSVGQTALEIAEERGHKEVAKLLIQASKGRSQEKSAAH